MPNILDANDIDLLWDALSLPRRRGRPGYVRAVLAGVAERGWAWRWQVEDLLAWCDPRLAQQVDATALCGAFGLWWHLVGPTPGAEATLFEVEEALPAVDLARLLMQIERLGFAADATPLVQRLRPALQQRELLTDAEVCVLWHDRNRHCMEPLVVEADDQARRFAALPEAHVERLTTPDGYEAELRSMPGGQPLTLTVHAPEHRARVASRVLH